MLLPGAWSLCMYVHRFMTQVYKMYTFHRGLVTSSSPASLTTKPEPGLGSSSWQPQLSLYLGLQPPCSLGQNKVQIVSFLGMGSLSSVNEIANIDNDINLTGAFEMWIPLWGIYRMILISKIKSRISVFDGSSACNLCVPASQADNKPRTRNCF